MNEIEIMEWLIMEQQERVKKFICAESERYRDADLRDEIHVLARVCRNLHRMRDLDKILSK